MEIKDIQNFETIEIKVHTETCCTTLYTDYENMHESRRIFNECYDRKKCRNHLLDHTYNTIIVITLMDKSDVVVAKITDMINSANPRWTGEELLEYSKKLISTS